MHKLQEFQAFLYANIPLVRHMKLKLEDISPYELIGSAPLLPNINDKSTVFGGSSAALMTICGWSIIKYQLAAHQVNNDVVIHRSQLHWSQAQNDDLIIKAQLKDKLNWQDLLQTLNSSNRSTQVQIQSQVCNQANEVCSEMDATYVILKND